MKRKRIRWSHNLAYTVGLITTDGSLSIDGRHIDFTSKDLEQIYNFAKILNLQNKIGIKSSGLYNLKYFRIQFGDVNFYKFLMSVGMFPNKSRTIGVLDIPNYYFRDFLRGHLDGDGSITTYVDRYNFYKGVNYSNFRIFLRFISASQKHILWIQTKIHDLTGIQGAVMVRKHKNPKNSSLWILKFSKKESIKLLNWMYYNPKVICLKRKRLIFEEAMKVVRDEQRKVYTKIIV